MPGEANSSTGDGSPKVEQSREGEHHGDYGNGNIPISGAVWLYAICASVNSVNLGYDIGASTNLGPLIQQDLVLTDGEREIMMGTLNFAAMFGALSSQFFSDRCGRRTTFLVAAFGFLNGLLLMAMSQSYYPILAGRVLVGLGVGVGFAVRKIKAEKKLLSTVCCRRSHTEAHIYRFRLILFIFQKYPLPSIVAN